MVSFQKIAVLLVSLGCIAATKHLSSDDCNVKRFQSFINTNGTDATVQSATYVPANGYLNPMNYSSSTEFPTSLPESCAVQISVASEGSSSYLVGIILPYEWNGRLLYVMIV